MSQPRSSGMLRSVLTLTPSMRGCFAAGAEYWVGMVTRQLLPANRYFRVVAKHEPVCRRFQRDAADPDVFADQAVGDSYADVVNPGSFEHDAVLDFRITQFDVVHDRRKWPHIRIGDVCARPDNGRPADDRALHEGAALDDHFALDARRLVD